METKQQKSIPVSQPEEQQERRENPRELGIRAVLHKVEKGKIKNQGSQSQNIPAGS